MTGVAVKSGKSGGMVVSHPPTQRASSSSRWPTTTSQADARNRIHCMQCLSLIRASIGWLWRNGQLELEEDR